MAAKCRTLICVIFLPIRGTTFGRTSLLYSFSKFCISSFYSVLLVINSLSLREGKSKKKFGKYLSTCFSPGRVCNWLIHRSTTAQYVFCKVYFSAQPNKLRPILKFEKYYPVEHIFVPACSSARKIHFFKF